MESLAEVLALIEDHAPRQSGLETVQETVLEQCLVLVDGNTSLFIMICNHEWVIVAEAAVLIIYHTLTALHGLR